MNFDQYEHYGALIFDMDGTLIDSGHVHENAWIKALSLFEIPIDRALMRSLAGVPTQETVLKLKEQFKITTQISPLEIQKMKDSYVRENLLRDVKATKLEKLVQHFHNRKPMAVGTGAKTEEAKAMLKACKLDHYFTHLVGADQVQAHKPAPDTFLLCASFLEVGSQKCVVFEDSPLGLKAADRAGMAKVDVQQEFGITNDYFL